MHCALLHTQTATHHGCNEFVHCCMPRPQGIVVHIASMAKTRMSLSYSRHRQCYLKIRYTMVRCGLGMQQCAMHNATIQKTTFFELGISRNKSKTGAAFLCGNREIQIENFRIGGCLKVNVAGVLHASRLCFIH